MAYTTLGRIKTWDEYFIEKKSSIPTDNPFIYPVDRELNRKVSLWQGDITRLKIDAIVNAANSSLLGGGGVDGAIHAAAGRKLYDACKLLNGTPPGTAKVTAGFNLPAKYIIHAVGPRDKDAAVLKSAYESSLNLSTKQGIRSVAFPCISTGIFGFPLQKATQIAVNSVRQFLSLHRNQRMDRVIFVVFGDEERRMYEKEMSKHFPIDSNGSTRGSSTSRRVSTSILSRRTNSTSPKKTKSTKSVLPSFSTKPRNSTKQNPTKLTPSERPSSSTGRRSSTKPGCPTTPTSHARSRSPTTGRRSSTKPGCPTTPTSHARSRSPTSRLTTRPGHRCLVRIKFSK